MDAFTLSLAIFVLFLPMVIYFALAERRKEGTTQQGVAQRSGVQVERSGVNFSGLGVDVLQTRSIHPVFRQNVAANRLVRLGRLG